jgi:predicted Rossmann fold nucleotide-binding protein DprA/Smf involved in DNA uptake
MSKDTKALKAIAKSIAKIGQELENISNLMINISEEDVKKADVLDLNIQEEEPVKPAKEKKEKEKEKEKKKTKTIKKKLIKKTKEPTVLDRVYKVIKRSRKGATAEKIKEATQLDKKQISNSLYKLTKKGMVKTISRGVYVTTE